jgi:hypothetical protein
MRPASFVEATSLFSFALAAAMSASQQGCSSSNGGGAGDGSTGGSGVSSTGGLGVTPAGGGSTGGFGVTPTGNGGAIGGGGVISSGGVSGGRAGASPLGGAGGSIGGGGGSSMGGGSSGAAGASSTGGGGSAEGGELPISYDRENTGADCPKPPLPAYDALPSVATLPDPFLMSSGNPITKRAEWRCRRAEIAAMVQNYELGTKPPPPNTLTAAFSGSTLTVSVTDGGGSIQLTANVTLPSGAGPFPAVIGVATGGTGALPSSIFSSRGVATVAFSDGQIAPQFPDRGQGAFYKLYPDRKVGSMIAWAWGISRIIDGLEKTTAQNKLDLKRLAVTGCSYAGKIALYAGAFDERIALTIPEESGGGGEAAWRVSGTMSGTEDLSHAQGTAWYHEDLTKFNGAPGKLPFDQHQVAAMVAPRALLTIGNPDIDYLASEAGYVSAKAASEVYRALGVSDRIGFSQIGGHGHCAFPSSQTPDVAAFVDEFLAGKKDANTNIAKSPYKTDLKKWFTWQAPQLQ